MKKKILVVDDEPEILEATDSCLTMNGYEVHTATNGEEAFDVARKIQPDLILLDVMMAKMTGYEFLQRLKKQKGTGKSVPVIVMSGKKTMKDFFSSWDIFTFLDKPFNADQLVSLITKALGEHDAAGGPAAAFTAFAVAFEEDLGNQIRYFLESYGFQVFSLPENHDVIMDPSSVRPDIVFFHYDSGPAKDNAEMLYRRIQHRKDRDLIQFVVFCQDFTEAEVRRELGAKYVIRYQTFAELIHGIERYAKAIQRKTPL